MKNRSKNMKTKFSRVFTLLLVLVVHFSFSQEKTVEGTVTDSSGLPLPGASVLIKGKSLGTSTGFDGKYSINVQVGESLVFSYVGYKTQEIKTTSSNKIDVVLTEDIDSLEEVVITAIGIKRKPDEITTANQVVKADELNQASNPDAVQALSGKVSGLQINTTSAGLNPGNEITLRGNRSISGNNSALVVIDNIVSSSNILSTLDPNSIESINVIKGANGAALYGELGAAGVIIVTTKKGTKNKDGISIDIKSSVTFEKIAYLPETQNRFGQGWSGNLESIDQGSWGNPYNGIKLPIGTPDANGDFRYFEYSHIEDNILPFFNTGSNLQNSVSISSGNIDEGFLNLSVLRQDIKGVIPNSTRLKNNLSLTAGKKINKFTVQGIARYTNEKTSDIANSEDPEVDGLYQRLSYTPGNVPIEAFSSGSNEDHWTVYDISPYWSLNNDRRSGRSQIIDLSADLMYEFNDHINTILRSSIRNTSDDDKAQLNAFIDSKNYFASGDNSTRSEYTIDNDNNRTIYTDLLLNFDYNLTEDVTFKSNIGFNTTDRRYSRQIITGKDLGINNFFNFSNITSIPSVIEENIRKRTASTFGQIDLGYKDYLFLNVTGRNDWNSVLPESNRSFFYYGTGVAFIATKAIKGLKNDILHKAKISTSYVKTGNATALEPHMVPLVANQDTFYPDTGLVALTAEGTVVDPNIKNEFVNSYEANINLEFLNIRGPRITLDASTSFGKNTDQLLNISSSATTGYLNSLINIGETKSSSAELDLGFTPIKTDDFTLNGRIGYSTFKTIVEKVTDNSDRVRVNDINDAVGAYAIEGQEFPVLLGTTYVKDNSGRTILDSSGNPISKSSLNILGKTTPDYILNFALNARYKNFSLSAIGDYRTGHVFYSGIKEDLASQGRTIETVNNDRQPFLFPNSIIEGETTPNTTVLTAATSSNGDNAHPYNGAYEYYTSNYVNFNENFITDATAFKLREVALTYDLPSKHIERLNISRVNIGLSGRNLLTILPKSNLDYNDPEFAGRYGVGNFNETPPTRFYSFSVNLAF